MAPLTVHRSSWLQVRHALVHVLHGSHARVCVVLGGPIDSQTVSATAALDNLGTLGFATSDVLNQEPFYTGVVWSDNTEGEAWALIMHQLG